MPSRIEYREGELCFTGFPLRKLLEHEKTPVFIISEGYIRDRLRAYCQAVPEKVLVAYAMKACDHLAVLKIAAQEGAGFDIVSGNELRKVLLAGGDPAKVIYSGVAKTDDEIRYALSKKIRFFNVESIDELYCLEEIAKEEGVKIPVALRVNPDIEGKTHQKINTGKKTTKFGIPLSEVEQIPGLLGRLGGLDIRGLDAHIGSQITEIEPYVKSMKVLLGLAKKLKKKGLPLESIDIGGGIGIDYDGEKEVSPLEFIEKVISPVREAGYG